jgi:hypothetical protein
MEPGEDGPRGREKGWQLGVPEGESGGKRVVGGEEEVSGTSAAVEAKISTSPSEPGANCCRSRARRLLPITRAPFGPGHTLADRSRDRSRPCPHWLRMVPLPATSSPLAPLPRSPASLPGALTYSCPFSSRSCTSTSGTHLWLPRLPPQSSPSYSPPAFDSISPRIPLAAFDSTTSPSVCRLPSGYGPNQTNC